MMKIGLLHKKYGHLFFLILCFSMLFGFCKGTGERVSDDKNYTASRLLSTQHSFFSQDKMSTAINNKISADNASQNVVNLQASLSGGPKDLPLYGFNGNISKGPSWTNKAFRDSVASLGLKLIRYPGGTVSNFWDWRKGGFVDDNSPIKKRAAFQNSNNVSNTLDDLKLLVNDSHCAVVFTLNMITSTLSDQIAMLEKAQSIGIEVKWIELGNEYNNAGNEAKQKFSTVLNYAKTCYAWAKALKLKFPNAEIAVVGGNKNYSDEAKKWNSIVSKNAFPIDAIVAHLYPLPKKVIDNTGINFKNLYDEFSESFNRQGFNALNNNIKIWVTEYNILWAANANEPNHADVIKNAFTWSQALATLLMTSECTSLSNNIQLILNHNIANTSSFAAIDTENKTFKKMPNGIGMELWLKASNDMTHVQKIRLTESNNVVKDYEVLGWKFSNASASSFLFVNLTANSVQINLNSLGNKAKDYLIRYAGKNDVIKGESALSVKKQDIENASITLPPYSVAASQ